MPNLLRFYDFDGLPPDPTYDVNLASHQPAFEQGVGTALFLDNGTPGTPVSRHQNSQLRRVYECQSASWGAPESRTASVSTEFGEANLGVEIPFHPSQFTGSV